MIYKLEGKDRENVLSLIKNTRHELTIECVVNNRSPGEVYADNESHPNSCFIKTPECNILAGSSDNTDFNTEIKKYIDYWDQITCDTENWDSEVYKLHPNIAIKKYQRKYFELGSNAKTNFPGMVDEIELIYPDRLSHINYENKELVTDWINITEVEKYTQLCLAVLKVQENKIISCSALDCINDNRIEIGIQTLKEYQRKGYGNALVSALVNESMKNGITKIGWHCVSTNIGSQKIAEKCGFNMILVYPSFTPYAPIENKTDLTSSQWKEYALFYQEKGEQDINQFWQAARCWAYAEDLEHTLKCINKLAEKKIWWFVENLSENEEFETFRFELDWLNAVEEFKTNAT